MGAGGSEPTTRLRGLAIKHYPPTSGPKNTLRAGPMWLSGRAFPKPAAVLRCPVHRGGSLVSHLKTEPKQRGRQLLVFTHS